MVCGFEVFSTRRFTFSLTLRLVLLVSVLFISIVNTSLVEERELVYMLLGHVFVCLAMRYFLLVFSLLLGDRGWL